MSVFCSRRWVAKRFGISTCHSARGRLHSLSAIPGRLGRLRAAADVLLRSLPSDLRVPPTSVGLANNLRCSASRLHSRLRRRRDRARATAYSEQDHQHNYLQYSYPPFAYAVTTDPRGSGPSFVGQYSYCKISTFQSYYSGVGRVLGPVQVKSGRSRQTVVNGPAMILAIANNIFSLRRSRGNEETYR